MTGLTYIDDIDLFGAFGVFVLDGGYAGLICYPPLKEPDKNDWHEYDGVEADLNDPKLDSQNFDIEFGLISSALIDKLIEFLSDGAYHEFRFEELGLTKTLRLVSQPNNKVFFELGTFSLEFADDFPLENFTPDLKTPASVVSGFEIDNKDLLAYYGIQVLEGIEDELKKSPKVKQNLAVNVSINNGLFYDDNRVVFEPKELNVKCFYVADIINNGRYWFQDYYNFLNDLVQAGERMLYAETLGEETVYYKSAKADKITLSGSKIWCEFSLTLVLTSYRPSYNVVLATEDGSLVITETEDYAIDLNK